MSALPVSLDHLLPFMIASAILLVIPGPTIVMVVSQALTHGRKVALASIAGVGLGDLVAATLSLAGVGTVLAASAMAFTVLKALGAAYLVYIGIKMWRAPLPDLGVVGIEDGSRLEDARGMGWSIFRDSFLVTVFNPKGIVFFVAFVPQFMSADTAFLPQASLLVAVFVGLGILNAYGYMILADRARLAIRRPGVLKIVTRVGAGFLVSAGIASLFARRAA